MWRFYFGPANKFRAIIALFIQTLSIASAWIHYFFSSGCECVFSAFCSPFCSLAALAFTSHLVPNSFLACHALFSSATMLLLLFSFSLYVEYILLRRYGLFSMYGLRYFIRLSCPLPVTHRTSNCCKRQLKINANMYKHVFKEQQRHHDYSKQLSRKEIRGRNTPAQCFIYNTEEKEMVILW